MAATYTGGGLSSEQEKGFESASGEVLDVNIRACGDLIRKLKGEKAPKDKIQPEVNVLLKLKGFYKSKTGQDWKPDSAPPSKPAESKPAKVEVEDYSGGGLTDDQVKALEKAAAEAIDLKIKGCGDLIRKMKADKAPKGDIEAEVKVLLLLKDVYQKRTGQAWKPSNAPAESKKKQEAPKKEAADPDEVSDKQVKRQAKKAEKQAKKAQYKAGSEGQQQQQQQQDDGEDIAAGKYGVAKMNQSQDKPDIRFIENFSILTGKLDNQRVWVRGRLHTSRAKGFSE